jgi:hypothetical protein
MASNVIGVVNYVIAARPSLLNFVIADILPRRQPGCQRAVLISRCGRCAFGRAFCAPAKGQARRLYETGPVISVAQSERTGGAVSAYGRAERGDTRVIVSTYRSCVSATITRVFGVIRPEGLGDGFSSLHRARSAVCRSALALSISCWLGGAGDRSHSTILPTAGRSSPVRAPTSEATSLNLAAQSRPLSLSSLASQNSPIARPIRSNVAPSQRLSTFPCGYDRILNQASELGERHPFTVGKPTSRSTRSAGGRMSIRCKTGGHAGRTARARRRLGARRMPPPS